MSMKLASGDKRRVRHAIEEFGPSLAVQSEADKTDIRVILEKAKRTGGAVAYMTRKRAFFADISEAPTYMEALNVVARARQQFDLLPAAVRDEFANDPARFLKFATETDADGNLVNKEAMIKMGLRKPDVVVQEPEPMKVHVVNAAPEVKSGS